MKNLIFVILVLLNLVGYSQITLDFQSPIGNLDFIKLNNSKTKYFEFDYEKINKQNNFSIYNLDGTLYKTIQMPPKPNTLASISGIFLITESLFDTDSTNIEYLVDYIWDSIPGSYYYQAKVVREDKTILLDEMHTNLIYYFHDVYSAQNTELGPKLILSYHYANGANFQTKVFSLPGKQMNSFDDKINESDEYFTIYPNPNKGSFYIKLQSQKGVSKTLDLYTFTGKLIGTFQSKDDLIKVNTSGLSDGIYFINNHNLGNKSTKKLIIKN